MARLIDGGTSVIDAGICAIDAGTCAATFTAVPLKQSSVTTSPRNNVGMTRSAAKCVPAFRDSAFPTKGNRSEQKGKAQFFSMKANRYHPATRGWLTPCTYDQASRWRQDETLNWEVTLPTSCSPVAIGSFA